MMSTVNLISQGKFKRLISKLDKSSATKLPQGNLVLQSGQGKHSHEGILTAGTVALDLSNLVA